MPLPENGTQKGPSVQSVLRALSPQTDVFSAPYPNGEMIPYWVTISSTYNHDHKTGQPEDLGEKIGPIALYGNPSQKYALPKLSALNMEYSSLNAYRIIPHSMEALHRGIDLLKYSPYILLHNLSSFDSRSDNWKNRGAVWRIVRLVGSQYILQACDPFTAKDIEEHPYGLIETQDTTPFFSGIIYYRVNGQPLVLDLHNKPHQMITDYDIYGTLTVQPNPQFSYFQYEKSVADLVPADLLR